MLSLFEPSTATNSMLEKHATSRGTSSTPARGRFSCERALVDKFARKFDSQIDPNTDIAFEVDSGNGIADIVVFKKRKDALDTSCILNIRPNWAYSLAALPYRRSFTASFFADLCCTTERTAERILTEFVDSGFCNKAKNGWKKVKQPRQPLTEVHAIEAKLKNWRRALFQATRYTEFADGSWVLLDDHHSAPALRHIEEFKKRNIGLLLIDNTGQVQEIFHPEIRPPRSAFRRWYAAIETLRKTHQAK